MLGMALAFLGLGVLAGATAAYLAVNDIPGSEIGWILFIASLIVFIICLSGVNRRPRPPSGPAFGH